MKIKFILNNCNVTLNQYTSKDNDKQIKKLTEDIETLKQLLNNKNKVNTQQCQCSTIESTKKITEINKDTSIETKKEFVINTETCLCTEEERKQLFGDNVKPTGEDLVNAYIEKLQTASSKEDKDKIHAEAMKEFYDNTDDMEYYQFWLKELQIFLDDPEEEIKRIDNAPNVFKEQCRQQNIESAMAEVKGNKISEQKTEKEKQEMPEFLKQFMVNYDDEYMRKLDEQSAECKEALNLIGQSIEIFEFKRNLTKIKELVDKITDKEEISTIRKACQVRQEKLIRQHDDEMFAKIFNDMKEHVEMATSVKQKWFKWYEFEKKFKALNWSSSEARAYAETDVHNFKEEKFPEWEQEKRRNGEV